jgi:hypothetical protein
MDMVILGVRVSPLRNNEWENTGNIYMEYYYWALEGTPPRNQTGNWDGTTGWRNADHIMIAPS